MKLCARGTRRSAAGRLSAAMLFLLAGAVNGCRNQQRQVLTLSVAASLQESIREAEAEYVHQHSPVEFRNNFGGSGTLAREIEEGAPVDAFIAAGEKPMNQLEAEGMLEAGTRVNLLRNSLVLIAPRGSDLEGFDQLGSSHVRLIALGDPASVPAGQYGKQTLESLHLYDQVKGKIVLGKDVRQVLTYVETGNADAGLVYATDAETSGKVRVVAAAAEGSHDPIVYPVAQIKGSHNAAAIRSFVAFLRSPAAQAIFERHGFHLA